MPIKILTDLDFDGVGRMTNLPDPINDGDAVNKRSIASIQALDFLSGVSEILSTESFIIKERRQSTNFIMLTLNGELTLDGDLWLA